MREYTYSAMIKMCTPTTDIEVEAHFRSSLQAAMEWDSPDMPLRKVMLPCCCRPALTGSKQ